MAMTKKQFKKRWESNENGGGITFDDVADSAKKWGISQSPRTEDIFKIRYRVLKAAKVKDADEWKP